MEVFYTDISKSVGFNCKNKKKPFYLLYAIFFIVSHKNKKVRGKIDKGFMSDGATIKFKILMLFIGCSHAPEFLGGSLIHDWLIEHPELVNYDRRLASKIFRRCLLNDGVSKWKANVMYYAVEIWQWFTNFRTKRWK